MLSGLGQLCAVRGVMHAVYVLAGTRCLHGILSFGSCHSHSMDQGLVRYRICRFSWNCLSVCRLSVCRPREVSAGARCCGAVVAVLHRSCDFVHAGGLIAFIAVVPSFAGFLDTNAAADAAVSRRVQRLLWRPLAPS